MYSAEFFRMCLDFGHLREFDGRKLGAGGEAEEVSLRLPIKRTVIGREEKKELIETKNKERA